MGDMSGTTMYASRSLHSLELTRFVEAISDPAGRSYGAGIIALQRARRAAKRHPPTDRTSRQVRDNRAASVCSAVVGCLCASASTAGGTAPSAQDGDRMGEERDRVADRRHAEGMHPSVVMHEHEATDDEQRSEQQRESQVATLGTRQWSGAAYRMLGEQGGSSRRRQCDASSRSHQPSVGGSSQYGSGELHRDPMFATLTVAIRPIKPLAFNAAGSGMVSVSQMMPWCGDSVSRTAAVDG